MRGVNSRLGVLIAAALLLAVAQASPAAAAPTEKPERYVVRLATGAATDTAIERLGRAAITVDQRYDRVLNGFAAELTGAQVRWLQANLPVLSVSPDSELTASDLTTAAVTQIAPPWGLDRIDQRPDRRDGHYSYQSTGAGVTVFVVDTGVRMDHSEFVGPNNSRRAVSGYDFVGDDRDASDCDGHGTHVAGTVAGTRYGVAKQAKIVSLRVLDCQGSGRVSDFIAALEWAVDHKPAGGSVINISAGGLDNRALDAAVDSTVGTHGIAVVVAAGNEVRSACSVSPAGAGPALTVAAANSSDRQAWFSDYGGAWTCSHRESTSARPTIARVPAQSRSAAPRCRHPT